ncbi:hypothetical protein KP509_34G031200 [Ceratopteris richardii]|uniref:Uncharacterized protein n=1 Tax=Ceratopteris richardii TaxID=49495 RepID=A0A8T2QKI3_CERRI|nr:hypothetical protein KP509_34G031200 [Ceratopteris richardii]
MHAMHLQIKYESSLWATQVLERHPWFTISFMANQSSSLGRQLVAVLRLSSGGSSSALMGMERDFFVEIWDLSGHERYKDCWSLFYSQINGVIFVHDLSQRKTKTNLKKWAAELAARGTFSTPMATFNVAGIPVPYLVVGNKVDIATKNTGSSGNLVDVARQWVEKQGFLSSGDELPLIESFPGSGLNASCIEGRLDMDKVKWFFQELIRRRYFGEDNVKPALPSWTSPSRSLSPYHSRGASLHDDDFDDSYQSVNGQTARYSPVPQGAYSAPQFSYPQQPSGTGEVHLTVRTGTANKFGSSSWLSDMDLRL